MRFKFIAIIALLVMMSGVIGILSQGSDDKASDETNNVPLKHNATYFVVNKNVIAGDIITMNDITVKTTHFIVGQEPDWLRNSINESSLKEILDAGGIALKVLSSGHILEKNDLEMMSIQLYKNYVLIPITVISNSLSNPEIQDKGFIDLYLLSNDNKVYRNDYFNERNDMGKEYKDTRVKLFASRVYYMKNFDTAKGFYNDLSGGISSIIKKSPKPEAYSDDTSKNTGIMNVVYAYFKKEDLSKVIQAQVLGVFVVSPSRVKNLNDGFSMIALNSWEVTPSDIVTGAPSPNDRNQILELRGAK